jgi:hypothetical protein
VNQFEEDLMRCGDGVLCLFGLRLRQAVGRFAPRDHEINTSHRVALGRGEAGFSRNQKEEDRMNGILLIQENPVNPV